MSDIISRDVALDDFNSIKPTNYEKGSYKHGIAVGISLCTVAIKTQASADPGLDEWCTDCKEYDQEKHSCPRWNRVIRETLNDMPERKTGMWIYCEDMCGVDGYRCDKCGFHVPWDYTHKLIGFIGEYHYCPNCGADMRGEHDE